MGEDGEVFLASARSTGLLTGTGKCHLVNDDAVEHGYEGRMLRSVPSGAFPQAPAQQKEVVQSMKEFTSEEEEFHQNDKTELPALRRRLRSSNDRE